MSSEQESALARAKQRDLARTFHAARASSGPAARAAGRDGPVILYGWHTVKAALENPERRIRRLLATENAARRLAEEGVAPAHAAGDRAAGRHRGASSAPTPCTRACSPRPSPCPRRRSKSLSEGIALVLDQITDPHNVGAILRSAAAFAVRAIVLTARHSPEATGVLAKSASGALEHVPLSWCRTWRAGSRR